MIACTNVHKRRNNSLLLFVSSYEWMYVHIYIRWNEVKNKYENKQTYHLEKNINGNATCMHWLTLEKFHTKLMLLC